jgi:hypothetical protein
VAAQEESTHVGKVEGSNASEKLCIGIGSLEGRHDERKVKMQAGGPIRAAGRA